MPGRATSIRSRNPDFPTPNTGFLLKRDVGEDLVRAIDAVRFGATFVSPGAARALYERYPPSARRA